MKQWRNYKMWVTFALNVMGCTLVVVLVSGFFVFYFRRLRPGDIAEPNSWIPLSLVVASGCLASTILTFWVSKHLFAPIEALCDALIKVASGDFSVQLEEDPSMGSQILQMNQNFNKMTRDLNSVELLQSDFIQSVSHEIKTPLAAIEGYASLLWKTELSQEQQDYAGKITESARRLSVLTSNVLKLSKLEKQAIVAEKERFSLDEQLREVLLSLAPLWEKKELEIDMELPSVDYYGNAALLYQIWVNLFSNAVKFTPKGGTIRAAILEEADGVTVEIADTGIGMNEDVQKHIFEKFYQGEKSRHMEGNGLGLALVKTIVELCEGSVKVESEPGKGSVFTVRLPR